jgi:hypothetical protein
MSSEICVTYVPDSPLSAISCDLIEGPGLMIDELGCGTCLASRTGGDAAGNLYLSVAQRGDHYSRAERPDELIGPACDSLESAPGSCFPF